MRSQPRTAPGPSSRWTGVVPFGCDVDADGHLIASTRALDGHGREHDILVHIFERAARGEGPSAIARWLNGRGVPSMQRYASGKVQAPPGPWKPMRVLEIVRSRLYLGTYRTGSRGGAVDVRVAPIVDEALWEAANDRMPRATPRGRPVQPVEYPLRDRLVCGSCGGGVRGSSQIRVRRGKRYRAYRCANASIGFTLATPTCTAPGVSADWLEQAVAKAEEVRGETATRVRIDPPSPDTDGRIIALVTFGGAEPVVFARRPRAPSD